MNSVIFLITLISIYINHCHTTQAINYRKKIFADIFVGYEPCVRPSPPDNGALTVTLDIDPYFIQKLVNKN
jgi:hypothetical protein